ncbi:MAG TPA: hypothetical protein VMZ91_16010 [Candidatus Paceibacterota bacterium]|nr:hypothetical protein [Candidatus Paceibacterota bacterium]
MPEVQQPQTENISDEEAIMRIAMAMKDNAPTPEEKHNVHKFLFDVVMAKDTTKIGNLQVDKDINELGTPEHTVRGSKSMQLIADKIMDNNYFSEYFEQEAEDTLATSLSREGFLIKSAVTQTKQIADITRRRKINKGWFGKKSISESGGENSSEGNQQ